MFIGSGFPYKVTNQKKGALMIIRLLGYEARMTTIMDPVQLESYYGGTQAFLLVLLLLGLGLRV